MKTMTLFWSLVVTVFSIQSSIAGVNLLCQDHPDGGDASGFHVILGGVLYSDCKDKDDHRYSVMMGGVGPGLEFASGGFVVSCPLVSKKRLDRQGKLTFVGANASASLLAGADVGVVMNERGGVCVIAGIQAGIGASIKIGVMKIYRGSLSANDESEGLW